MNRLWGILIIAVVLYLVLLGTDEGARGMDNQLNLSRRMGQFGVLTLGVGLLIISGGIDLSIGSVVGLSAVLLALLLEQKWPPALAIATVLALSAVIGLTHGLLITYLRLQPFILTLCGLFVYRGLAQWITHKGGSSSRSIGLAEIVNKYESDSAFGAQINHIRDFIQGKLVTESGESYRIPTMLLLLLVMAVVATVILHLSVYGRYLYAIGYNEQAARYAGIPTNRYKIFAYVWCSFMAGFGGFLLIFNQANAQPSSSGSTWELYAITGAVLGGCSLRGGQGTVLGMLLGAAVLPMLRNLINFADIPTDVEFTVIGIALLFGTIVDELLKRRSAQKTK